MPRILDLAVEVRGFRKLTRLFLKNRAIIFMAHRFSEPGVPGSGHDPEHLRRALERLRDDDVEILPLWDLIQRGRDRQDLSGRVAFTVDDGYSDFFHVAAPIFREYQCPVTLFPVTGFLDGQIWMWWDRIRYLIMNTRLSRAVVDLQGNRREFSWDDRVSRVRAFRSIRDGLTRVEPPVREATLRKLESSLELTIPAKPPPDFSPLTWEQVRRLGTMGVTFGPHTVDHPNLATISTADARAQICRSWDRIRQETSAAVPVFCFPYGRMWSMSPEVSDSLRKCGLKAAVTAEEGHVSAQGIRDDPFHLPRMGWPETDGEVARIVSGLARAKEAVFPSR